MVKLFLDWCLYSLMPWLGWLCMQQRDIKNQWGRHFGSYDRFWWFSGICGGTISLYAIWFWLIPYLPSLSLCVSFLSCIKCFHFFILTLIVTYRSALSSSCCIPPVWIWLLQLSFPLPTISTCGAGNKVTLSNVAYHDKEVRWKWGQFWVIYVAQILSNVTVSVEKHY